jgi:ferredoxin-NADP reductase
VTRPSQPAAGKRFEARVAGRRWLTEDTFLLDLERPPAFRFRAGQRIQLWIAGTARDYSLISGEVAGMFTLLVRRVPDGPVSGHLSRIAQGTRLVFAGPSGHFVYRPSPRPAVFVATGTGVAPFAAMGREGVRGFTLLHGVRRVQDLYFRALLEAAADPYIPCLTGAERPLPSGAFAGRVTRYIEDRLPAGDYDFYLAGRHEMIAAAMAIMDACFPSSRVYSEIFY